MYFMVTPTFKHNAMAFYVYGKSYGNLVFQLVHVYVYFTHFSVTVKLINSIWR